MSTFTRRSLFAGVAASSGVAFAAGSDPKSAATVGNERPRDRDRSSPAPVRFVVGCQKGPTDDRRIQFWARHGVKNVCGWLPNDEESRGPLKVDELVKLRERAQKWGVSIDCIGLPFLVSEQVDEVSRKAIEMGESPARDRDIEWLQKTIEACARAGIPMIKYNMNLLGVMRTKPTTGRGGMRQATWRLKEADANKMTRAGRVPAEAYWERITYFLDRVIPVATEHKVKMACHPHDPGAPPGFRGIDLVLGTVEGLKKFVSIQESPYHGLNFCQGTISEMLHRPAEEIFDVIRHFGQRKKIFNVHFRNIRGQRDDFQEVLPDDGDVDMARALKVYREVGYDGMLMPDHCPKHSDDPGQWQAFAFSYGYIRALIQAAEHMT